MKKKSTKKLPLSGITVLDISRLIPGPFASLILSDLGAEVIRLEDPDRKDYLRFFPPMLDEKQGALFAAFNRGKKEVSTSLTRKEDRSKIESLIRKADVLIESFRPGILGKMGWPLKKLTQLNKKLIVASITGFGQKGPLSQKAGHDLNYMALSGLLEAPHHSTLQWADLVGGGLMGALMITSALANKNRQACHLDISMTDNMAFLGLGKIMMSQLGKDTGVLNGVLARYRLYRTQDGGFVSLGALEDKFWNKFCDLNGKAHLKSDKEYSDTNLSVHKELEELFASKTRSQWAELGLKEDICLSPVLVSDELIQEKQFLARKFFTVKKVKAKKVKFPKLPFNQNRKG